MNYTSENFDKQSNTSATNGQVAFDLPGQQGLFNDNSDNSFPIPNTPAPITKTQGLVAELQAEPIEDDHDRIDAAKDGFGNANDRAPVPDAADYGERDEDSAEAVILDTNPGTPLGSVVKLEGDEAIKARQWREEGFNDDVILGFIYDSRDEAAAVNESLRFETTDKPSKTKRISVAAIATIGDAEEVIDTHTLDPNNADQRLGWAARLHAKNPRIDKSIAQQKLMEFGWKRNSVTAAPAAPDEPDSAALLAATPEEVLEEAEEFLKDPQLIERIGADIQALGVAGEQNLATTIYLIGVGRLLPKPVGAIIQAPTSTGKSFIPDTVANCFPPEAVLRAHSITANALYYLEPGRLKHRFVVAGERSRRQDDDSADATKALRELLSDGTLRKLVTDTSGGAPKTIECVQEGPISYIESTTAGEIFAEDANRCLILSTNDSQDQTKAIVKRIAQAQAGEILSDNEGIIQRHHAMQRMLQQHDVLIPYAVALGDRFPTDRVEARRAIGLFLAMVKASALLHQFQRETDDDGRLIAEQGDYELACRLCRGPLARNLGGQISDAAIRFHERLVATCGTGIFTTTEVAKREQKARQSVLDLLHELVQINAVEQVEYGRGSKPSTWKVTNTNHDDVAAGGFDLPSFDELMGTGEGPEPAQAPQQLRDTPF